MAFLIRHFPPTPAPALAAFLESALGSTACACEPARAEASADVRALPIDLAEDDAAFTVRASLPGFQKDDVDVSFEDGVLSILAKHVEQTSETGPRFLRQERTITSLGRRITLPAPIAEQDVTAELKDGILTLRLPKVQKPQPQRIQVRQN